MDDIILYHGSRGGLAGDIKPISRERCDFGRGFYMGQSPEQVKGLILEDSAPMFYTLNLKLSEIPEERILILDNMEWVYTVLACRDRVNAFCELDIAKEMKEQILNADIIIGPIADDKMNEAMSQFSEDGLTDRGLLECLRYVDYGYQYVARTEFACSKIEIISERPIYDQEVDEIRKYSQAKRLESKNIVQQIKQKYQREGRFLFEIINDERNRKGTPDTSDCIDGIGDIEDYDIDL